MLFSSHIYSTIFTGYRINVNYCPLFFRMKALNLFQTVYCQFCLYLFCSDVIWICFLLIYLLLVLFFFVWHLELKICVSENHMVKHWKVEEKTGTFTYNTKKKNRNSWCAAIMHSYHVHVWLFVVTLHTIRANLDIDVNLLLKICNMKFCDATKTDVSSPNFISSLCSFSHKLFFSVI